ncbi:hypothetical protein G7Y89_g13424 [Cudoniella acicularis]|uniref:Uncharacterized protein n=1 Tax=Cudoniella acicularis TaxID=354080 RepID=A0A8H4VW28_9HELO|nr:hypothetical protein G7Y89_g13424 [Cudoniella acicularis]
MGKIDDFTIRPVEQHSFLLIGFSRHTSSRPSFGGTTLSTAAEAGRDHVDATRIRPQEGRAVDAGALASRRSKPSISDDDGGLSDSDSESSSDDDGCSSEGEQGRSSTSKHSRCDEVEGASGGVNTGRIVRIASPHDTFTASELASAPTKSIDASGLWYGVEEGCYIEEPAPGPGSHKQRGVPSAPAQA